ncbi:MAG: amidohydrolase [Actinomycetota bacterium]
MRTLYRATRVHTLFHPAQGEWLLADGRHVQRVGSGDPPAADRVVDLPGATIVPGFIDSHVHLTGTGIHEAGPDLTAVRSAPELVRVLTEAGEEGESTLLTHGWDETKWDRPELPSLEELDRVTQRPLVAVRTDGHICLANTRALSDSGALDYDGVERGEDGGPTGVLRRQANVEVQRWFHESLADHDIEGFQLHAAGIAASRGITCVHEMAIPALRGMRDVEVLLRQRERLPVDVVPYVATTDIPLVMDLGLARIGGDLSLDGSIGARTAHLSAPYDDGEGSGVAYLENDDLSEFLHNAHLAGLQVGLHVIGDAAIEQAVACWERVYGSLDSRERRHFRARRHRLEHFEMPSDDVVERTAMLGLAVSVQPAFDAAWGHPGELYEQRVGEKRAATMNPFRTYLSRGIEIGGGSDAPITALDAWAGIRALEQHHDDAQRFTRDEAVRVFTWGSARLAHLDDKKGRLVPGAQADFAAYDDDPMVVDSSDELRPVLTVSLGREVFAS